MRTGHVFLLLCILGVVLFSSAAANNGNGPEDCCFKFFPRRVNKRHIRTYYMTDDRCPKSAAIMVTVRQRKHICVDPSLSWVQGIMKSLDEKDF
ncbi:C-C motif chemokine 36.1 [Centroberyx affinis]|uniref:C-C motif chemokine 36.1 n=1 Tax=Centroberyx affinis TaxID=166261 RepID=UPI003A5BD014